jgi:hypothetical protein
MGFIRACELLIAPVLVSLNGDEARMSGVVGARLLVDGVGEEEAMSVGSPLGFKGLKPSGL